MNIVVCKLYICNYPVQKVALGIWRDVDNKTLIKRAEEIRGKLLGIAPQVQIIYEEHEDDCFGGRKFYEATIVVDR